MYENPGTRTSLCWTLTVIYLSIFGTNERSENVLQEGSKRSRSYKNNGPKRPEFCKMGGGGRKNEKKMAVTKIQWGGWSNPQNIHIHVH